MAGLDDVESAAPALVLESLAGRVAVEPEWAAWLASTPERDASQALRDAPLALRTALHTFLARYGHRALSEGELRAKAWEDDPAPVLAVLRALGVSERSAAWSRRARAQVRRADEEALLARLGPLRRALLRFAIVSAQRGVRERERTKSLTVAMAHFGRRLVRAAARLLVVRGALRTPDDVFFLEGDELVGMLSGGPPVSAAVLGRRRRRFVREGALPVPRDLDLATGESGGEAEVTDHGSSLRGIGVSGGIGRGPARVLVAGRPPYLEQGEVLVATVLDAALGPWLASAAGAVAEVGGILSHGAVVARELGVPCVVDVRGATQRIRSGEEVLVDGTAGSVFVRGEAGGGTGQVSEAPAFLTAEDEQAEGLHTLEPHPSVRESVFVSVQDPASGLRLVATLGRGTGDNGEALVALALPDGRTLFGLDRTRAFGDGDGLGVGRLRADFRPVRVRGDLRLAAHESGGFPPGPLPLLLSPRTVRVAIDLTFRPSTPSIDFCRPLGEAARAALRPLGEHHLEQTGEWVGSVEIEGQRRPVQGFGHRDHSFGLRDWSALDHSHLFVARFGDDLAVHALILSVNGTSVEGGFLWRNGRAERVASVLYTAERQGNRTRTVEVEVRPAAGPVLRLRGAVEEAIRVPVALSLRLGRHLCGQPYALLLEENFVRYETENRIGYGMAELSERPQ